MPEFRTDWLTGRSVFVAENRSLRPNDFLGSHPTVSIDASPAATAHSHAASKDCPFCAGNEQRTPTAIYEVPGDNGAWQVRVVPNMYPAVSLDQDDPFVKNTTSAIEQSTVPAIGTHEVIIESPLHVDRFSALAPSKLRSVIESYAARLRFWRDSGRFSYGLVFKNQGDRAGASMAHLHSQFVALPTIPPAVAAELDRARQSFQSTEPPICPYCRLIEAERSAKCRVVFDQDGFFAFCPYAGWQPYETWLMPSHHASSFEASTPQNLDVLSRALHQLITRLESRIPEAAYNMILRTAPWGGDHDNWYHWRIELLPRTNAFAGLEVATGIHINPLAPEHAAAELRSGSPFSC